MEIPPGSFLEYLEYLGHFFIADEFFDCNQAILSLGGEGCSRSAVLAILILNSIR